MGNLLASAARGIAIGHERDTKQKYKLEEYDHQAEHAQTLEEMRNKNNMALQKQSDADAQARATTRSEHEISMYETETDWKESDREDTQSHDIEMQLGDSYLANMKASGTVKSHGWSLSTEMVDVPNPDDPLAPPTSKPFTMMHSDDLGAFQQVGDKLYATGDPQQPKKQLTSAQESAETARLLENLGDWQAEKAFIDEFGYLPYIYAVRLRQSSDSGMSEYVRKNMAGRGSTGGPIPATPASGGRTSGAGLSEGDVVRDRMDWGPQGQAGVKGALNDMSPEEWEQKFRAAAERNGHSPEKIDKMVADAMRFGFGPNAGTGSLTEGAAATETPPPEVSEILEELEKPTARSPEPLKGKPPVENVITLENIAEIGGNIAYWMSKPSTHFFGEPDKE